MAACMTVGLMTAGVGAFQYSSDADDMGKLVQYMVDRDENIDTYALVQLLPQGSEIKFSEPVDVSIYVDGEYGTYTTKPVQSGCTSFTIPDAKYTYVFTGTGGGQGHGPVPRRHLQTGPHHEGG